MKIFKASFLLISSFFCLSIVACQSNKITVIGTAKNDKNVAIVLNKQGQYFLRGLHHWDSVYLNKKVKVTGTLFVYKYKEDTLRGPDYSQSWHMDMYYILSPKWKIVK